MSDTYVLLTSLQNMCFGNMYVYSLGTVFPHVTGLFPFTLTLCIPSLKMGNLVYKLLSNFLVILESVGPSHLTVQAHLKA